MSWLLLAMYRCGAKGSMEQNNFSLALKHFLRLLPRREIKKNIILLARKVSLIALWALFFLLSSLEAVTTRLRLKYYLVGEFHNQDDGTRERENWSLALARHPMLQMRLLNLQVYPVSRLKKIVNSLKSKLRLSRKTSMLSSGLITSTINPEMMNVVPFYI